MRTGCSAFTGHVEDCNTCGDRHTYLVFVYDVDLSGIYTWYLETVGLKK